MALFTQEEIDNIKSLNNRDKAYQSQFSGQASPTVSTAAKTMANQYAMPQAQSSFGGDYRSILDTVKNRLTQPAKTFQYNADNDSAFQAAANAARSGVSTAQANTNARLRATGQGKSSYSDTVANQIAQKAESDIANNIRPQYEQQAYNRFTNEQSAERQSMNDLLSIGQGYNTLDQQAFQNALAKSQDNRADSALTGRMQLPEVAQNYINQILDLKRQAAGSDVTSEQMAGYRDQADALRQKLAMTGVNPDIVGYESDYGQALQNVAQGTPTLQGRDQQLREQGQAFNQGLEANKFDYQKLQDQIKNGQWDKSFYLDMQKWADDKGLKWANFDLDTKKMLANIALDQQRNSIAQQNANTSAFSAANSASNAKERLQLDKSKLGEGNLGQLTSSLNQTFGSFNEDGKFQGIDSNKSAQLRQAIINMNLPDYQTDQLLASYGLPTN